MQTGELIIIRGLPGSGKSTLSEVLSENGKYPVFSIDDYFTDDLGNYNFEYSENHKAYKQCESRTEEAMRASVRKIFIDNVFSLEWEMDAYLKLAGTYNYRVHIVTVENRHGSENVHNVSFAQIERMAAKYKVKLF